MFRMCTLIALTTLAISSASKAAPSLEQRMHDAAAKACAVEAVPNMTPPPLALWRYRGCGRPELLLSLEGALHKIYLVTSGHVRFAPIADIPRCLAD